MIILILFAFLAGIVTLLSPCILPILPVVLSGSVGDGKRRPLGVVSGFIISFTFFTLFLSTLVQLTGISADALRTISVVVIGLFGISQLVPQFQMILEKLFTKLSQFAPTERKDGFSGGFAVGISLGLIWTPCVGPILASVIALALTGSVSGSAAIITFAYALGTALPMLVITYSGRTLLQKNPWLLANTMSIQKAFGVLMILTAFAISQNYDRQFQAYILEKFPQYGAGLTAVENNSLVQSQLDKLGGNQESNQDMKAPELIGGTKWVNSEPLIFENELKGKVVLVDFWTYSCINCIRTFPYLKDWYAKYKDQGFVIVGVHSPEFEFEKDTANVTEAMSDFGLTYPVVQDNDFAIWRAFNNRFWPAHYLVDKEGYIRYTHFGEGKYLETENEIRRLLDIPDELTDEDVSAVPIRKGQTPETYLGYERAESYQTNPKIVYEIPTKYTASGLALNSVGLQGTWQLEPERAIARGDSTLGLRFQASKVFLVLGNTNENTTGTVTVLLDDKPVPAEYRTADMDANGVITVTNSRKYDIVNLGDSFEEHTLELQFSDGTAGYAFTFESL